MITLYFTFSCSSITFLTKFRNLSRWMCEDELQIIQTHLVCISKQLKTKRGRKVPAVWWRVQCNVSQLFLNPAHRRNKNNFSHPADLLWSSDKNVALQTLLFFVVALIQLLQRNKQTYYHCVFALNYQPSLFGYILSTDCLVKPVAAF